MQRRLSILRPINSGRGGVTFPVGIGGRRYCCNTCKGEDVWAGEYLQLKARRGVKSHALKSVGGIRDVV